MAEPYPNDGLFGKALTEPVTTAEGRIELKRIPAQIVFERTSTGGVRVTARDSENRPLWGYVASDATVGQYHTLVGMYTTLRDITADQVRSGRPFTPNPDPLHSARTALASLEETLTWFRNNLDVKQVSQATERRAQAIARIAADADAQIMLEASGLKGMKPRIKRLPEA